MAVATSRGNTYTLLVGSVIPIVSIRGFYERFKLRLI